MHGPLSPSMARGRHAARVRKRERIVSRSAAPVLGETRPPRRVILIDGGGYIARAFHAFPPLYRPDGVPVNAVYGMTIMLMRLLKEEQSAESMAMVLDTGRRTFRNDLYHAYKAHRPPLPESLAPQLALIRDGIRAFSIASVEQAGYEADDLIATYARQAVIQGANVTIFSADKDLMQLVRHGIVLWDPLKKCAMGPDQVRKTFGVAPCQVADVQALAGDPVDNVPGVPGIGVKRAAALITFFGDLESLLARVGEIPQERLRRILLSHAARARLSRALTQLKDDISVVTPLTALRRRPLDPEAVRAFLRAQAFDSLLYRFEKLLRSQCFNNF